MPSQFSLARALQYLLDEEVRPPWLSALTVIPLIVFGIWLMSKPPPKADASWARRIQTRAIVRQKRLNVRHEPVLVIEQGTLLAEEIDWGKSFFSLEVMKGHFPSSSREEYLTMELYSLTAYAAVGDSLIKQAGDSSALVKRGKQVRVFYFRSLWP